MTETSVTHENWAMFIRASAEMFPTTRSPIGVTSLRPAS